MDGGAEKVSVVNLSSFYRQNSVANIERSSATFNFFKMRRESKTKRKLEEAPSERDKARKRPKNAREGDLAAEADEKPSARRTVLKSASTKAPQEVGEDQSKNSIVAQHSRKQQSHIRSPEIKTKTPQTSNADQKRLHSANAHSLADPGKLSLNQEHPEEDENLAAPPTRSKITIRDRSSERKSHLPSQNNENGHENFGSADHDHNTALAPDSKTPAETEIVSKEGQTTRELRSKSVIGGDEESISSRQNEWSLSRPYAGRYINCDPIFVQDENRQSCLLSATSQEVQLISLETSLIIRTHAAPSEKSITCFCLSAQGSDSLDVVYDDGAQEQWNWITSKATRGVSFDPQAIQAMTLGYDKEGRADSLYITSVGRKFSISKNGNTIYTTKNSLTDIQTAGDGAYVIALGPLSLVLGAKKDLNDSSSEYTWVEVPAVKDPYICMDVRVVRRQGKTKKSSDIKHPGLTVAAGNAEGQIHLFSDLSNIFGVQHQPQLPPPRILHWHRESVSTVKFSKDGNYLISGGKETVLVLWQLETGKQQFLPHLTSKIERITVSPEGDRYALQMGDNSIMVLNTSELIALAYVAGIQLPVRTKQFQEEDALFPRTTAVINPRDSQQLLLTVPSSQPETFQDVSVRPFLQTFDLRTFRHVSRQALARNNVTDFNRGPEQTAVVPPDVSLIAISEDGQWLATVDEWIPPASDLEHTTSRPTHLEEDEVQEMIEQQERAKEVYLKFWHWNDATKMWTLSTRADAPHARLANADQGSGAGRVLKLAADPTRNGFVTIGEDGQVKIWRPKTRTRHGVALRDDNQLEMVSWVCKHSIAIPTTTEPDERLDSPMQGFTEPKQSGSLDACLAFSEDGSVIACCTTYQNPEARPLIYFISPVAGEITATRARLATSAQPPVEIGFLGRYFIALSAGAVRVWNLINDKHHYTISFNRSGEDVGDPMLSLNHENGHFAVLLSELVDEGRRIIPRIQIYGPRLTDCLFEAEFTTAPVSILADRQTKGFVVLFEDGTIRKLAPTAASTQELTSIIQTDQTAPAPPADHVTASLSALADGISAEKLLKRSGTLAQPAQDRAIASVQDEEDDRQVVRTEQLAAIFDVGHSYALPPVRDMFQAVVELYRRKPQIPVDQVDSDDE